VSELPDLVSPSDITTIDSAHDIADRINRRYRERFVGLSAELAEQRRLKEHVRIDRDRVLAERNTYASKIERVLPVLDEAHQTIAKLQLDVGILNGRLIERTEAMGERQREYLDRARKAESVAREALGHLETLAGAFLEASKCANQPLRHAVIWREAASDVRKRVKALTVRLETSTACGQSADKTTEQAVQTEGGAA